MGTGKTQGFVSIKEEECKGCELCIAACPVEVLYISSGLNDHGYHPVQYSGNGCTGCGVCFYVCPEPGALTVHKRHNRVSGSVEM